LRVKVRKPAPSSVALIAGDSIVPDKPDKPEQIVPAKITVTDTGIAPFIFFKGAPNFGFANGVVNITLAATRHL
jgi:hypothetical protein